jgi:hypothetical protein
MRYIQKQIKEIRQGGLAKLRWKIRHFPIRLYRIALSFWNKWWGKLFRYIFRPWIAYKDRLIQKEVERKLHNDNLLWYTLSPMLLTAILKAFKIQTSSQGENGKSLLEGHGYYEFGVFKGFSFWFAEWFSREYTGENFRFYGFDSFEGLPKSHTETIWREGNYAAPLKFVTDMLNLHETDFSKVKLYKGFFSKQLFESLRQSENFLPCSICVIDCDLYESTIEVLNFIKNNLVPGSILLFDEYTVSDDIQGEKKAFLEFEKNNPGFQKERLFDFGKHGVAFKVIAV